MCSNEAAERLREACERMYLEDGGPDPLDLIAPALAAERRATVERIRKRWSGTNGRMRLDAILDEEATPAVDIEAEVRRAMVERLQSNVTLVLIRHHENPAAIDACDVCTALRRAILDEEAARC